MLICISLIIIDAGHLLLCLLAIFVSSLEKCLFGSSACFPIGLFFAFVEVYELFVCFGNQALVSCIICKYFLSAYKIVFSFSLWLSLLCKSLFIWLSLVCLSSLLFLLPWETDPSGHWYNLCRRKFCLCSFLGALWCQVLYLVFKPFCLSLCMVCGWVLISVVYMQLSSFPSTTCWSNCPSLYIIAFSVKD